ncbi:MAG: M43 family zinc metalloprotease, partial [Chitinophagaceae bacterium]
MVRYLLSAVLVFCFCVQNVVAQKVLKTKIKKKERCYTAIYMKKAMEKNSKIMSTPQFENWMRSRIDDRRKQVGTLGLENGINNTIVNYTLPIVFHIIHSGETVGNGTNIAQNKIYAQVAQLNRDFANLSGSNYAVASHTGIKFGLATQTPSGSAMPEPGIDRVDYRTKGFTAPPYDPTTDYVWEVIKAETIWDPNRYVNIWVMDASESGILGIATFPSASTLDGLDEFETNTDAGVIIDASTVGSTFTSVDCADENPYELGRTLTHELGHFFGLRHIWGDDNCGDDFCGDTPTHEADNSGRPAHPKPNSCGTADEMFENYMDYTDDRMVHTFTFNQVERMQTVMANSLRRKSLATSNVPVVMPNFSNKIAFANCSGAEFFTETGKTGVSVRYNDIKIPVSVEGAATGNATVTINTSGTAVNGVDYQLLTPSLSFTSGDFAKNIEIRVIDNAKVDPTRTITITYTINGAGVSAAAAAQTVTLYLFDDDDIIVGQNTVNLFSESFSGGTIPAGWETYDDATNVFTVSTNGNAGGTGAAAHVTNNATTKPNTYANSIGYAILETPLIDATRVAALNELSFKYRIRGRSYNFNSVSNATSGHYGLMTMSLANDPNGNLGLFGFTSGDKGYGPYG